MPSPRNSSPAPSRSFATSLLNERSAIRVRFLSCVLFCVLLRRCPAIDSHPRRRDYMRKNTSPTGSLVSSRRGETMRSIFIAGLAALAAASTASAQETTLRAVSSFAEKTTYSRGFELFIERVNKEGKGVLQINYIGGPKAMPPFEVGNALKSGVVDLANVTGAFYTNVMPEADAWKLTQKPMAELRQNGGYAYMAGLYEQKMNAILLARHIDNNPFHLYLTKPIAGPDLTGLKLRITPVYRDFFQALGATVVQTAPGEVYTALERGVVDGYGWPITGIFDLGWHEKPKYRVDPGFYSAEVSILINKNAWAKLNDRQKQVISEAAAWIEAQAADVAKENEADIAKQKAAGIQVITLGEDFRTKAYEAGWAGVIRQSPEHGPKLKALFSK